MPSPLQRLVNVISVTVPGATVGFAAPHGLLVSGKGVAPTFILPKAQSPVFVVSVDDTYVYLTNPSSDPVSVQMRCERGLSNELDAFTIQPFFMSTGDGGSTGTGVTEVTVLPPLTQSGSASYPLLGVTVGSTVDSVCAGDDPRLSNGRSPIGEASGDLSGSFPSPVVAKVRGVNVSPTSPNAGQVLQFDGAQYEPTTLVIGQDQVTGLTGDISGLQSDVSSLQGDVAAIQADYVPNTRQVIAGAGLEGGGPLTADVTLSMPNVGTAGVYGSATQIPVITTDAQGRISSVTPTAIGDVGPARVYYVSKNGTTLDGGATGAINSPFNNIPDALAKAEADYPGPEAVEILVAPGEYVGDVTITRPNTFLVGAGAFNSVEVSKITGKVTVHPAGAGSLDDTFGIRRFVLDGGSFIALSIGVTPIVTSPILNLVVDECLITETAPVGVPVVLNYNPNAVVDVRNSRIDTSGGAGTNGINANGGFLRFFNSGVFANGANGRCYNVSNSGPAALEIDSCVFESTAEPIYIYPSDNIAGMPWLPLVKSAVITLANSQFTSGLDIYADIPLAPAPLVGFSIYKNYFALSQGRIDVGSGGNSYVFENNLFKGLSINSVYGSAPTTRVNTETNIDNLKLGTGTPYVPTGTGALRVEGGSVKEHYLYTEDGGTGESSWGPADVGTILYQGSMSTLPPNGYLTKLPIGTLAQLLQVADVDGKLLPRWVTVNVSDLPGTLGVDHGGTGLTSAGGVANRVLYTADGTNFTIGQLPNATLANSSVTVSSGTGLTGGGSVSLGGSTTLSIANTTVAANTYGTTAAKTASFTVNAQGQLTAASEQNIAIAASQVTSGTFNSNVYVQSVHQDVTAAISGGSAALLKGQVVYLKNSGGSASAPAVDLSLANASTTALTTIGVVASDTIPNNNTGNVITSGVLTGLNTNGFNQGDILYVDATTPGSLTNVMPTYPNYAVPVAIVIVKNATVGAIYVDIELDRSEAPQVKMASLAAKVTITSAVTSLASSYFSNPAIEYLVFDISGATNVTFTTPIQALGTSDYGRKLTVHNISSTRSIIFNAGGTTYLSGGTNLTLGPNSLVSFVWSFVGGGVGRWVQVAPAITVS